MSAELYKSVFEQLTDITHLEYLSMAENDLSQVSMFTLNNKKSLRYLDLENTKMSAELCRSICEQLTHITHLEHLNMSENDLSLVSMLTLNNKRSLRYLDLRNTHMSSACYHTICHQLTDLENLEQFAVSREDSGYMICGDDLVPQCFLSDEQLSTHVCRRVFHQINQFSYLYSIEITDSPLTGCLSTFIPNHHPGLPYLFVLQLICTLLNKEDLQHLFNIIQVNKLPKLRCLDLSYNSLTGCLSSFLPDTHPGLPDLDMLHLKETSLNKEDVQYLSHIIQNNKLPKLRIVDLSENTLFLTRCLSSFPIDPYLGIPNPGNLYLWTTALNKVDQQQFTHLIETKKVPLDVDASRLSKRDIELLIKVFETAYQNLGLGDMSEKLKKKGKTAKLPSYSIPDVADQVSNGCLVFITPEQLSS